MTLDPLKGSDEQQGFRLFRRKGAMAGKQVSQQKPGMLSRIWNKITGGKGAEHSSLEARSVSVQAQSELGLGAPGQEAAPVRTAVDDFHEELESTAITHFVRSTGLKGRAQHLFRQFFEKIIGGLKDRVKAQVYKGAYKNLRGKVAVAKLAEIDAKLEVLEGKLDQLKQRAAEKGGFPKEIIRERDKINGKKFKLVKARVKVLGDATTQKAREALGEKARDQLQALGGKSVKIEQKEEGVTLDAMHMKAESFHEMLKGLGAQRFELTLESGETISSIAMPEVNYHGSPLQELGLAERCGWVRVIAPGGQELMVEETDLQKMIDDGKIHRERGRVYLDGEVAYSELEPPENSKTILVTSGSTGDYERHKREILSLLMMGHSVVGLNLRAVGESTGKPTETGWERDMEAGYQLLRDQGVEDSDIVIKALCLSGGPAANLHANHPATNLIMDQSYSHFERIVRADLLKKLDGLLKVADPGGKLKLGYRLRNWCIKHAAPIAKLIAKLMSPKWHPKKDLRSMDQTVEHGFVGLLTTKNDVLMKKNEMQENRIALLQAGTNNFESYEMSGSHADAWFSASGMVDEKEQRVLPLDRNFDYYLDEVLEDPELPLQEAYLRDFLMDLQETDEVDDELARMLPLLQQVKPKLERCYTESACLGEIEAVVAEAGFDKDERVAATYALTRTLGISYVYADQWIDYMCEGLDPEMISALKKVAEGVTDGLSGIGGATNEQRQSAVDHAMVELFGDDEPDEDVREMFMQIVGTEPPSLDATELGDIRDVAAQFVRQLDLSGAKNAEEAKALVQSQVSRAKGIGRPAQQVIILAAFARIDADNIQHKGQMAMRSMLARC